jgi:hypothetical protein
MVLKSTNLQTKSKQNNFLSFVSIKEDMYLNTKDFINEIKQTLNKKLQSANGN